MIFLCSILVVGFLALVFEGNLSLDGLRFCISIYEGLNGVAIHHTSGKAMPCSTADFCKKHAELPNNENYVSISFFRAQANVVE